MLFNSYIFIYVFLPVVIGIFLLLKHKAGGTPAISWLIVSSLVFYGWHTPAYVVLLIGSVLFNYVCGSRLRARPDTVLLSIGVTANLGLLGYFKYTHFIVENIAELTGTHIGVEPIVLPLAISFFTFQQIAYLVDSYRGKTEQSSFLHYCFFVTFFPQLIAGPIVHHSELLPQVGGITSRASDARRFSIALTIFFIGLFKKTVLADGIEHYATTFFSAAGDGDAVTFMQGWVGALAYTFQIYFDFSGYSDMAIGLGYLLGIRLPINFQSPYKAHSIRDFWRRWHITLSRFLREYLYIPLGGNRKGSVRQGINIMVTMFLGGLWHGAGWTFVIWGGIHGIFIIIEHVIGTIFSTVGLGRMRDTPWGQWTGRILTFTAVTVAWVFFRAENLTMATSMLKGMAGLNGAPILQFMAQTLVSFGTAVPTGAGRDAVVVAFPTVMEGLLWITGCGAIAFGLPSTQEFIGRLNPAIDTFKSREAAGKFRFPQWRPSVVMAVGVSAVAFAAIVYITRKSEFIYFRF